MIKDHCTDKLPNDESGYQRSCTQARDRDHRSNKNSRPNEATDKEVGWYAGNLAHLTAPNPRDKKAASKVPTVRARAVFTTACNAIPEPTVTVTRSKTKVEKFIERTSSNIWVLRDKARAGGKVHEYPEVGDLYMYPHGYLSTGSSSLRTTFFSFEKSCSL
jgi:hypothetical protein